MKNVVRFACLNTSFGLCIVACSVVDRPMTREDATPAGREGDSEGAPETRDSGPDADAKPGGGGPSPDSGLTCQPACDSDKPICSAGRCIACKAGAKRCSTLATPESCETEAWRAGAACGGDTPVCSHGVCTSMRLTSSFVVVAPTSPDSSAAVRLAAQRWSTTRSCGKDGNDQVCVTGSIGP